MPGAGTTSTGANAATIVANATEGLATRSKIGATVSWHSMGTMAAEATLARNWAR